MRNVAARRLQCRSVLCVILVADTTSKGIFSDFTIVQIVFLCGELVFMCPKSTLDSFNVEFLDFPTNLANI